ncbi:InlB B-repeat-containing protein [Lactococcus sp. dk101]|uniref:InlB B-repeat-containing protein n=3 Tax=unclassified Lactococcus TaxID=2643510 RepID=UPI0012949335|nr:InlB B-repeat-containing protein [Lactococcus sp. dk101]MQW22488.1 LPXTG cell wall anchor domain-containing protein [Lactococcus sp. dk101]
MVFYEKKNNPCCLSIILSSQVLPVVAHASDLTQASNNNADGPPVTQVVEQSSISTTEDTVKTSDKDNEFSAEGNSTTIGEPASQIEETNEVHVNTTSTSDYNKINVSIDTVSSFQTYNDEKLGTTIPDALTLTVNISSQLAGLEGAFIEIPYDGFTPNGEGVFQNFEMTSPIFEYIDETVTLAEDSNVESITNDKVNRKIILKLKTTTIKTETVLLKFKFNDSYNGKIPASQVIWDNIIARVTDNNGNVVYSTSPKQVTTTAVDGMSPYITTQNLEFTGNQIPLTFYFYNNNRRFSYLDETKENKIYLQVPENADVSGIKRFKDSEKVTSTNDSTIPVGFARYYIDLTDDSNTFTTWEYSGDIHYNALMISDNLILPSDLDIDDEVKVTIGMIYTKINGEMKEKTDSKTFTKTEKSESSLGIPGTTLHGDQSGISGMLLTIDSSTPDSQQRVNSYVFNYSNSFANLTGFKNAGTNLETGIGETIFQTDTSSQKADFANINIFGLVENSSVERDYYRVKYVVTNSITGESRIAYSEKSRGSFFATKPTLEKGEYVDSFTVQPMGTDGESEGQLSPGNGFYFTYKVKNWSELNWPDGTSIPQDEVIKVNLGSKISYDEGEDNIETVGKTATYYYAPNPIDAKATFVSSNSSTKTPGELVNYSIMGYNEVNATTTWDSPEITVAIPNSLEIIDEGNLRYIDKVGGETEDDSVSVSLVSSDNEYNYYRFTAEGKKAARNVSVPSFEIPVNLRVKEGTVAGTYKVPYMSISSSNKPFVQISKSTNNLTDSIANSLGYDNNVKSSYTGFNSGLTDLTVARSTNLSGNTQSRSSDSSPWTNINLFAVDHGATPEMKASVSNKGNTTFNNIRIYDILPSETDGRGSTGAIEFTGLKDTSSSATVYYTTKPVSELPEYDGLDLQSWNSNTLSNYGFSTVKPEDGITAVYIDYGNQNILPGKELEGIMQFKVPAEGNQKAINQFLYSAKEVGSTSALTAVSDSVTFSTMAVGIMFNGNTPDFVIEGKENVTNMPDDQSAYLDLDSKATITIPQDIPTLVGYEFSHWVNSTNSDDIKNPGDTINFDNNSSNQIYYNAVWTPADIKVKFSTNYGENPTYQEMSFSFGKNIDLEDITNPVREGYSFVEWNSKSDGSGNTIDNTTQIDFASSKTYYAIWKANSYNINFDNSGGKGTMDPMAMTYDQSKALTANTMTKEGYTFQGWATSATGAVVYKDKAEVTNLAKTGDVTLYAVWAANSYNVKFDNNGGKGTMDPMAMTYDQSKALTANTMTKDGYTFQGWATSATGAVVYKDKAEVTNLAKTGDVTLYAVWAANSYDVKFDNNGGKGTMDPMAMTYDQSKALTANTMTKDGYTFQGWATSATGAVVYKDKAEVTNLAKTGDVTLYAVWAANSYDVQFDANGGKGSMDNLTLTYDQEKALTTNSFTKDGYTFQGWATSANGSVVYKDKAEVKNLSAGENVTLYAVWKVKDTTTDDKDKDNNSSTTNGSNSNHTNNTQNVNVSSDSNLPSTGTQDSTSPFLIGSAFAALGALLVAFKKKKKLK